MSFLEQEVARMKAQEFDSLVASMVQLSKSHSNVPENPTYAQPDVQPTSMDTPWTALQLLQTLTETIKKEEHSRMCARHILGFVQKSSWMTKPELCGPCPT